MTTTTLPSLAFRLLAPLLCVLASAGAFAQEEEGAPKIIYNKLEPVGDPIFASDGIASLFVSGKYLYVATNVNGLQVFDISDPFTPVLAGSMRDLGIPTSGIARKGNYLYISDNVNGINIVNISNPAAPVSNASVKTASGEAWDLCLDENGDYLFVATGKAGVEVWSLENPAVPTRVATTSSLLYWNYAWGVSFSNKKLYVADREGGVKILDVSRPTQPRYIGGYAGSTKCRYVIERDGMLYLGNGEGGFEVVNVKTITMPTRVFQANYNLPLVIGVALYPLNPNMVVVATGRSGLAVYDTRLFGKLNVEPLDKFVGNGAEITHVAFSGHAIYAGSSDRGFQVFNYDMTPVFTNLKSHVVNENEPLTYKIEGNDPDSSSVVIALAEQSGKFPAGFRYDQASQTLSWTPTFEQSGIYSFIATIQEQTRDMLSRTEAFTIEVKHINRAPSLPQPPAQVTLEDSLLVYVLPEGSDPDVEDAGKLTYAATNLPRGATFDPETRKFSWTPDFAQAGDYVVTFTVKDSDSDGANDGKGALTDSKEMKIRVDNVNLNPEFVRIQPQTFYENKAQTFALSASDPDAEDEGKLVFKAVKLPQGATFDGSTRMFSWTPTFEQAGNYVAEFVVEDQGLDYKLVPKPDFVLDDTMTVFIEVKQTNRPPAFAAIEPKTIKENEVLIFKTPASDPDREDAGKLSFSASNLPEGATYDTLAQTFSWKPTYEQSGNYVVSFRVVDTGIDGSPLSDVKEVPISVIHVNRPPKMDSVASKTGEENSPITFSVSGSDPDREDAGKLTISVDGLPKGATFDGANFSWTPDFDQNGVYKLTFTIKDPDGLKDSKSATIAVANTNRPPKFEPVNVSEARETQKLSFTLKAIDPDKEDEGKLVYKAGELPKGAVFTPSNQTFVWTPTHEQSGEYQLEFTVTDRGLAGTTTLQPNPEKALSDKLVVPIVVKPLNRKPKIEKVAAQTVGENEPLTIELKATDPDKEDEGKLAFSIANLPDGAKLEGNKLVWTPSYEQAGKYVLNAKVTDSGIDGTPLSDETQIVITVKHVNRPPKLADLADVSATVEQPISFAVSASDDDKEDEGKLKIAASNLPKGATFKSNQFQWTPTKKQAGSYDVTFTVTDKSGAKDSKTVKITVSEPASPAASDGQSSP
ncbi:MAG: putative Ig domain-containing protein [Chloroherpetonaceae bacterium]|nr:putative Ig domain-containing protein [Chloroherpetonaceae bacterium]